MNELRELDRFEAKLWEKGHELHSIARKLFAEDFFWSEIEPEGPLSAGTGTDAFFAFLQWRIDFPKEKIKKAPRDIYASLGLGLVKEDELPAIPKPGVQIIPNPPLDKVLLSIAFAQAVAEGCIDKQILSYSLAAIARRKGQVGLEDSSENKLEQFTLFRKKLLQVPIEGKEFE